jgi:hypothetical protein
LAGSELIFCYLPFLIFKNKIMKENLNLVCNMVMSLSLILLLIVGFVLCLVIGYELCFKIAEIIGSISNIFWWLILSLIGTFLLGLFTSIINTEKK